jgi:hypothetical protein
MELKAKRNRERPKRAYNLALLKVKYFIFE